MMGELLPIRTTGALARFWVSPEYNDGYEGKVNDADGSFFLEVNSKVLSGAIL